MADFDLSSQEGRQEARDAGYWVGEEGGQIVAEYTGKVGGSADPNAPSIGGGGGGGGGYSGGGGGMQPAAQQLGSAIDQMFGAIASGNKAAFDEAVRQFNVTFGLDEQKFAEAVRQYNEGLAITQAGLTGQYQGQQTQQAQQQAFAQQQALAEMYGQGYAGFGAVPGGQQTLAAQQQAYSQGLGAITAAAGMQANPFRQQQVIGQLGRLLGGQGVAGFQAPNVVQGVGTAGGTGPNTGLAYMRQLLEDIQSGPAGQNSQSAQGVLDAIPTPNKLNSADFLRASPSTQSLILQGMQEKYGLDPSDSINQIKNTLPQFRAPTTFGTVRG